MKITNRNLIIIVVAVIVAAAVISVFWYKSKHQEKRVYRPELQDELDALAPVTPYTPDFPKELMLFNPQDHKVVTSSEGGKSVTSVEFSDYFLPDYLQQTYEKVLKDNSWVLSPSSAVGKTVATKDGGEVTIQFTRISSGTDIKIRFVK